MKEKTCEFCGKEKPNKAMYCMEKHIVITRYVATGKIKEKSRGDMNYWCKECWDMYED